MKTKMLSLALLLSVSFGSSFAGYSEGVNDNIISSFKKDFSNAREIKWEPRRTFVKATFMVNEVMLSAYYRPSGELIAFSRAINQNQLPVQLELSLRKRYSGFAVKELAEIVHDNTTSYYVMVENQKKKLVLEGNGETWTIFQAVSKTGMDDLKSYLSQAF